MTVLDGRYIYVIGGRDSMNETPLESIERLDGFLDLDKQKWESLQHVNKDNMWSSRDTLGSFALNDSEILIFGGKKDGASSSSSYIFDTQQNQITKTGSLPNKDTFYQRTFLCKNGKVYAYGYENDYAYIYNMAAKTWSKK